MKQYKVILSQSFKEELENIFVYISSDLKNSNAAIKIINEIFDKANELETFPYKYPTYEVEPWKSKGLRKLVTNGYLIFYIVYEDKKEVLVMHVFKSNRNMTDLLDNNNSNQDE
jgi:toxin ParE1/3/4